MKCRLGLFIVLSACVCMPVGVFGQTIAIVGATIIDGNGGTPIEKGVILIDGKRIVAVGGRDISIPAGARRINAAGKYVVPGLMNANVHLLIDVRMENLVRFENHYEGLIEEAAQVSLKNGVTTVFDSWGPREPLIRVRDRIQRGEVAGSRIFLAGNIVGFDGPFSPDFYGSTTAVATGSLVDKINQIWVENVGPDLMWMAPEQVRPEIQAYSTSGIDFLKYAVSGHGGRDDMRLIMFSPEVQKVIVEEARRAGITVQTHTTSVESLRMAVEAGVDVLQHCELTGPVRIPDSTLRLLVERNVPCASLAMTDLRLAYIAKQLKDSQYSEFGTSMVVGADNQEAMIAAGVTFLLATDGGIYAPNVTTDPIMGKRFTNTEDDLTSLEEGHFHWLKAMEQKGLGAMAGLMAATKNIAVAYKKEKDLGTVEKGKIADLLILDANPLQQAANYRRINLIMKEGAIVDRDALPTRRFLTAERAPSTCLVRP